MKNKTYYVYKTTNNINNNFYIGVHYGYLDDNYFGSGKLLKMPIKEFGKNNFTKEVIAVFDDRNSAYCYETTIIQDEMLHMNDNCYNISPNHDRPGNRLTDVTYEMIYGKEKADETIHKLKTSKKANPKPAWNKGIKGEEYSKHYSQQIKPPSMLGRIWINNGIKQTKIPKEDHIPEGWVKGRCDNLGDNNPMRKNK